MCAFLLWQFKLELTCLYFSTPRHESLRTVFPQQVDPVYCGRRIHSGNLTRMRKYCCRRPETGNVYMLISVVDSH